MQLCLVSFQAILLAVLVINYHYIDEVEAEKQFSVGNWFNSMERKVDIQLPYDDIHEDSASEVSSQNGVMNRVFRKIRKTADDIIDIPRRLIHPAKKTQTTLKFYNEDADISALVNNQELADLNPVTTFDASDVTQEVRTETDQETPITEVVEKQEAPKKRRRSKKHKRKHKPRPKPEQNEEQQEQREPQEQNIEVTTEKDTAEFSRRFVRKEHRRKGNKKKFVKMAPKEDIRNTSNNSDSDEIKRRKPVDIIVHIKMNE